MSETEKKPIVVSENAGAIDTLTAALRYLVVIAGTIPLLLTFLGQGDVVGLIAYLQSADGVKFTAAVVAVVTLAYGLWKTRKRGAQIATVAMDARVPNAVAKTT